MINFNEMPFNRFAEVMRKNGEYSQFYLLNTLAAARAGNVTAAVKAAFDSYDAKKAPKPKAIGPRAGDVRKAAQDAGRMVYVFKPCPRCGGVLRYASRGTCVACQAARQLALDDELRADIAKFVETHSMELVQQVHGLAAKRMAAALDPDSDLSVYMRNQIKQDMRTILARMAGIELNPEQEAKRARDAQRRREKYKRQKDKKRQEMAA